VAELLFVHVVSSASVQEVPDACGGRWMPGREMLPSAFGTAGIAPP
jgi:hypothetical protein